MPPTSSLLQFALASLLLALTPGPSIVLVVLAGTDGGRRAGVTTSLGLAVGTLAWGVVAAAGLETVLRGRPELLRVVTALGGAYLLWLAVQRFRAARVDADVAAPAERTGRAFRDGLVVNLLNPSISLFLAALVPPFLAVGGAPVWQQVLVLSVVLAAVSTVVNIGWGVAGAVAGRRVRDWAGDRRTAIAVGTAYAGLAAVAFASAATG